MRRQTFLRWFSAAVGSMDAVTGLLLVLAPGWVLARLGIAPPSVACTPYLSWIGVFVLGVGLSYALVMGKRVCAQRGETVWMLTAGIRLLVAAYLALGIGSGSMESTWWIVAASDACVAMIQILVVRAGWWRGGIA